MEKEMRVVRTSITRMAQWMDAFEEKMEQKMELLPVPSLGSRHVAVALLNSHRAGGVPQERRDKMQLFLTALGGSTRGTAIHKILRRVATNDVLKQYSLLGRKGYYSGLPETLPGADYSRRGGLDWASAEVCPTQTAS